VAAWVIFGLLVGLYYEIYLPTLEDGLLVVMASIHGSLAALVFLLALRASWMDAGDEREHSEDAGGYCYLCEKYVPRPTKHCRSCEKCVAGFDHHCIWLNTCIGSKNYILFVTLLAALFLLVMLEFLTALTGCLILKKGNIVGRSGRSFAAMIAIYCLVSFVVLCWVTSLLAFHVKLIYRNQTTYDFHVQKLHKNRSRKLTRRPTPLSSASNGKGIGKGWKWRNRVRNSESNNGQQEERESANETAIELM